MANNTRLSLEYMQSTLPKNYRKVVTQETVDELNLLSEDPDYGEEFKSSLITHASILSGKDSWSLGQYTDAIKFYSLTAGGLSQVEAYVKVFPDRLQSRLDRGQTKLDMTGEASRYNSTELVNRIRQQALVPLHLVNQGTLQQAINSLTTLMLTARSEVARVSAATALLKELRPPEAQSVELQLGLSDEMLAVQEKQTAHLLTIAQNQQKFLEAGHSIDDIQKLHVNVIDAEVDEDE